MKDLSWYNPDPRHAAWRERIVHDLGHRPLGLLVDRIERFARSRSNASAALYGSGNEVQEVLSAWTGSRQPECLPRALYRYRWLRGRGLFPELLVGVHVPTDRMHAWVELDGHVIGEEPDEMLCFQGAVRYFSNIGSRAAHS